MNKLEQLIKELCPDGVEYVVLNTVCQVFDGTHQTPKYTDSGVKFASVENIANPYDTKKYISYEDFEKYKIKPQQGDVLMTRIGSVGICTVLESSEPLAYYVSLALLRPNHEVLNSKFLKYSIESLTGRKELQKRILVNAVPIKINVGDIGKIKIPVPPLPVQEEIVRILDDFTERTAELTSELTKELEARKKLYAYYRDKLLTMVPDYRIVELKDVCTFVRGPFGGALKKEIFQSTGYAVYEQQNAIYKKLEFRYFIDKEKFGELRRFSVHPGEMIVSCSGTIGRTFVIPPNAPEGVINQALLKLTPNEDVDVFYLQYFFENTISKVLNSVARGGAIKNVPSVDELKVIKMPLPPLDVQKRLVNVLDNFDAICSDLNIGLPAEIEARKKQYEFYRDMLLTFAASGATISNQSIVTL